MNTKGEHQDWFLPAIMHTGSLDEALSSVESQLEAQKTFIKALRFHIQPPGSKQDNITLLYSKSKVFKKTLDLRLSSLDSNRPGEWFREYLDSNLNSPRKPVSTSPVLSRYQIKDLQSVKEALLKSFHQGAPIDIVKDFSPCLWIELIRLSGAFKRLQKFQAHSLKLNLARDNSLPEYLNSASFKAFLTNISRSLKATEELIQACFQILLRSCEKLWDSQNKAYNLFLRVKNEQSSGQTQNNPRSQDLLSLKKHFQPAQITALEYFGFKSFPDLQTLKKQYHTRAKELHPDHKPNNEEAFKELASPK